jgi:PPOX class probable F420-dependent enzyme
LENDTVWQLFGGTMQELTIQLTPHIASRLKDELVIWLTTVSSDGTPQPNPVWFYWDGTGFIIYSRPSSARIKNIIRNPRVSLNFEGAEALGGDVMVFTGVAEIKRNLPSPHTNYVAKYKAIAAGWERTVEEIYAEYCVTLQIIPTKLRVF